MRFYKYNNFCQRKLKHPIFIFITLLMPVLFGCSNEGADQNRKSSNLQKTVRLDPNSAPLIPSQRKAKATDFSAKLVNGETFQLSNHVGEVATMG